MRFGSARGYDAGGKSYIFCYSYAIVQEEEAIKMRLAAQEAAKEKEEEEEVTLVSEDTMVCYIFLCDVQ